MRIINSRDIMETIEMLTAENLDVRTVTMGISLLDCIDPDADKACEKIYNKITRLAGNLVSVVDGISAEYGIPIVNKRISVTPIAMLLGAAPALLPPLLMLVCLSRLDRLPPGTQGRDAARVMTVFSCLLAIGLGWWISLASSGTNAFIYFQF